MRDKYVDFLSANTIPSSIRDGVPIGTIKYSVMNDSTASGYLLCDGRSCAGTLYSELTGQQTTPDLRGQFLVGASALRPAFTFEMDTTGLPINPFVGIVSTAGLHTHSVSVDLAGAHTHSYTGFDAAVIDPAALFDDVDPFIGRNRVNQTDSEGLHSHLLTTVSDGAHTHAIQLAGGDSETAPLSFTVHYYLKVNEQ